MADKSKQFDISAVGSDDYLSTLNRRLEVLERRLVGQNGFKPDQPPLKETLEVRLLYQSVCNDSDIRLSNPCRLLRES